MRPALARWANDADALHHVQRFGLDQPPLALSHVQNRAEDLYISLVGELFLRLREPYENKNEWSRLGNALTISGNALSSSAPAYPSVPPSEWALYAATAFYFGGFSASAYLTLRAVDPALMDSAQRDCFELLSRTATPSSPTVQELVGALRRGRLDNIHSSRKAAAEVATAAVMLGPTEWVGCRLFERILSQFEQTNIRAVLPSGDDPLWDPLVKSFLDRKPPVWDFFPSQIAAIRAGLLGISSSFAIQMPTGAGKTALTETLLYYHLKTHPNDCAILLVPYRSLAAELRGSLVKQLRRVGITARSIYGGTVPSGAEVDQVSSARAIVATPEALSGLLSADPDFFARISLVICDEGHLLDSRGRGVGLELLLARLQTRAKGPPKTVFVSAIVPNIEEINAWLGGSQDTVVRSDFRPSVAEFALLDPIGTGAAARVDLTLHPQDASSRFSVEGFLQRADFRYRSTETGQLRTYPFSSLKAQAIASARKALPMGAVAVFATNKRGQQGAVGLAEELLQQLSSPLALPNPQAFATQQAQLQNAVEYFTLEYGSSWIGTRSLAAGVVLHHGDIPQESREVVECLLRDGDVRMAICTSTLAEGVNLPIRTLVLYSVQRRRANGATENLLSRDIKNLVGRAGRAGSSTKGLVICVNPSQWHLVAPAALQAPGERVAGALLDLMTRLSGALAQQSLPLSNEILESTTALHALVDGIDSALIDLATDEIGEDELVAIATEVSLRTYAVRQAQPEIVQLIGQVFALRARRISSLVSAKRLGWLKSSGARVRLLDSVEQGLLLLRDQWDDLKDPQDPILLDALLSWALTLPEIQEVVSEVFGDSPISKEDLTRLVSAWLDGLSFASIADVTSIEIDTLLHAHSRLITFALQTVIEQGVNLLASLVAASGGTLARAVLEFPDHLRRGVPTPVARILATEGLRHRRAAVMLAESNELSELPTDDRALIFLKAREVLRDNEKWRDALGTLVLEQTLSDLAEEMQMDR